MNWIDRHIFSGGAAVSVSLQMAAVLLAVTERRARQLCPPSDGAVTVGNVLVAACRRLRSMEGRGH